MERYHIFKLGLAILFYAAYCARPMLVYSLEADNQIHDQPRSQPLGEYYGYYQGLDGQPGIDFPVYSYIPRTSFSCKGVESGYYADLETDCQVFHICESNKKISFLCPNGTIFQQADLICEWWNKVNCSNSPNLYESSAERLQNDIARRKLSRRVNLNTKDFNHGAIMRIEESSSVTATKNGKTYPIVQETRGQNYRNQENNHIELNLEESNNKHLARANAIQQNNKHPNHRYNEEKSTTQVKKDMDKSTGNFVNNNLQFNKQTSSKNHQGTEQDSNFNRGKTSYQTSTLSYKQQNSEQAVGSIGQNIYQDPSTYQENFNKPTKKSYHETQYTTSKSNNFNQGAGAQNSYYQENQNNQQNIANTQYTTPKSNMQQTTQVFGQKTTFRQNYQFDKTQSTINQKNTPNYQQTQYTTPQTNSFQQSNQQVTNIPAQNNYQRPTNFQQNQQQNNIGNNYQYTQYTTPKSSFEQTTQLSGQKTTLKQNSQFDFSQKIISQSNTQRPVSGFTSTPSYRNNQPDFRSTQRFNDGTTRPIPNFSQNGVQNTPQNLNNIQDKGFNINYNNNKFQTNEETVKQPLRIFVPPQQAEALTVPSRQAESITVPPQRAESIFVPPRSSQSISVPNQNTQGIFVPAQTQGFSYSTQTIQTTTSNPKPQNEQVKSNSQNFRGNKKFKLNEFDDGKPKRHNNNFVENRDENTLPEFPKHRSELKSTQNNDLDEAQITQESASFVQSPFNSVQNNFKTSVGPYPNHRSTYSPITPQVTYKAPKITSISSITPHLVTTQPINNGKPFVGSKVGSTFQANQGTSTNGATYLPTTSSTTSPSTTHEIILGVLRHSTTTASPYGPPEQFNVGRTDKTLPSMITQTTVTNSVPTDLFNVGKTNENLQPSVTPSFYSSTTVEPLNIYVPDEASLNEGYNNPPKEAFEPPFVKKFVPLLYSSSQPTPTSTRTTDHAIVYGSYGSSTLRPSTSLRPNNEAEVISVPNNNNINQGVSVRFNKGQDKVAVHLTKSLEGQSSAKENPASQNLNEYVRISAGNNNLKTTAAPFKNGFLITKAPLIQNSKSQTQKPRPFAKNLNLESNQFNSVTPTYSTYPSYSLSSARPFQKSGIAESPQDAKSFPYDNVDNMLNVLKEIAGANKKEKESIRTGLVIPPSVSPQTLHSLAQYFANELDSDQQVLDQDTKEEFTGLLTQMTVHGYNTLFKKKPVKQNDESNVNIKDRIETTTSFVTSTTPAPTFSTIYSTIAANTEGPTTTVATFSRSGSQHVQAEITEPPELRQLARNFSVALSSYLKDPDNFRMNLESFRPTEPPVLEGEENNNSDSGDEELLNFSDADLKSSTPFFYPTSPSPVSPTWGYILANTPKGSNDDQQNTAKSILQDDVKNSLSNDLSTADTQSFSPKYNNNFGVKNEVNEKGNNLGFTFANHWTSSPEATKLWQKTLSVNPLNLNDNLVTTPLPFTSSETTDESYNYEDSLAKIDEPSAEISYELKSLPPLNINATQIHGILLDFMNHTKTDDHNRLQRILKKLNTSEDEFLSRMREIESNPLTKRLILLLISECGANLTHSPQNQEDVELLSTAHSSVNVPSNIGSSVSTVSPRSAHLEDSVNSSLIKLVDPNLKEEDQDARALQLLNALYSIASRFGKK